MCFAKLCILLYNFTPSSVCLYAPPHPCTHTTHTHTHTEEEEEDEEYMEEDDNANNNIDMEHDSYYQVKAVLDHRLGAAGLLEFRIHWAGLGLGLGFRV
jgi:hypothetical protein